MQLTTSYNLKFVLLSLILGLANACGPQTSEGEGGVEDKTFQVKGVNDAIEKIEVQKLEDFSASASYAISDDETNVTFSLSDFLSQEYLSWIQLQQYNGSASQLSFACAYDLSLNQEENDLLLCSNLHPQLFDGQSGEFQWQPFIDNGNYEFWLYTYYNNEEILKLRLEFTVKVLRISVIEVESSWLEDTSSDVPVEDSESVLVAMAIFKNPNSKILTAGSTPQVDFANLSDDALKTYLLKAGYDQSNFYKNFDPDLAKNTTDLLKLLPISKLVISQENVYLSSQLTKEQFINFAKENTYQKLSTAEKMQVPFEEIRTLKPDRDQLKAYMEHILARHFGSKSLGIAAPTGFEGADSLQFEWDLENKAL